MSALPLPECLARLLGGAERAACRIGESGAGVERIVAADGGVSFLKMGTGLRAGDVCDEFARLQWLARRWPVPAVRHFVATPAAAWLWTEALPGRSAFEELERATTAAARGRIAAELGRFLRRLHAVPTEECPFRSDAALRLARARARLEAGEIDESDFDAERAGWTAERVWAELLRTRPRSTEEVVTHGDFSLDNVFLADGEVTGCLDVGRTGVADRYQDLAILTNCLDEFGAELTAHFFAGYGLSPAAVDPQRIHFHRLLDECF